MSQRPAVRRTISRMHAAVGQHVHEHVRVLQEERVVSRLVHRLQPVFDRRQVQFLNDAHLVHFQRKIGAAVEFDARHVRTLGVAFCDCALKGKKRRLCNSTCDLAAATYVVGVPARRSDFFSPAAAQTMPEFTENGDERDERVLERCREENLRERSAGRMPAAPAREACDCATGPDAMRRRGRPGSASQSFLRAPIRCGGPFRARPPSCSSPSSSG